MTAPSSGITSPYSFINAALSQSILSAVPRLPGAVSEWLADGVLSLKPTHASTQPAAIISVGVHGDEIVPIRLLDQWLSEAVAEGQDLARPMLLILANPAAYQAGARQVEHNLNRLFSHQNSDQEGIERSRAAVLMAVVEEYVSAHPDGLHFDLHSTIRPSAEDRFALVPPACADCEQSDLQYWFGRFAVDAWVQNTSAAATFANFTAQLGYLSATVEVGQVTGPDQPLDRFLPLIPALADLSAGRETPVAGHPQAYQVVDEIIRPDGEFTVVLEDFVNFRTLAAGTVVAESADRQWTIQQAGDALLFLNPSVGVGQRVALIIRPR